MERPHAGGLDVAGEGEAPSKGLPIGYLSRAYRSDWVMKIENFFEISCRDSYSLK